MPFIFKPLSETDIPNMHKTFLEAFADYQLPFGLSLEQFIQKFVQKLHINYPLSVGTFYKEELVGFIFTSIAPYRGVLTAYNGGTGVIPIHRGKGLTRKMYDYLLPLLRQEGIGQCVLEVLTENEKAIKTYKHCGFDIHTRYLCFKLNRKENTITADNSAHYNVRESKKVDWDLYTSFYVTAPSYLDTIPVLVHNIRNEYIAEASIDNTIVGYIIFQPSASRISQIAVREDYRRRGVGKALIAYAMDHSKDPALTIINIDHHQTETIASLKHLGFENTIDQYEMVRKVNRE